MRYIIFEASRVVIDPVTVYSINLRRNSTFRRARPFRRAKTTDDDGGGNGGGDDDDDFLASPSLSAPKFEKHVRTSPVGDVSETSVRIEVLPQILGVGL